MSKKRTYTQKRKKIKRKTRKKRRIRKKRKTDSSPGGRGRLTQVQEEQED